MKHMSPVIPFQLLLATENSQRPHYGKQQSPNYTNGTSCGITHWGRDTMDAISQTTFSNAFSWTKMQEFRLKFHWSLFLKVQLTIFHHWFRQWLGGEQATSHYLNQWWPSSTTHICVTRPQWDNLCEVLSDRLFGVETCWIFQLYQLTSMIFFMKQFVSLICQKDLPIIPIYYKRSNVLFSFKNTNL